VRRDRDLHRNPGHHTRTEAANTAIKHIKRTGCGNRNHRHYQARILLRSHRQTRRLHTRLNQQATTAIALTRSGPVADRFGWCQASRRAGLANVGPRQPAKVERPTSEFHWRQVRWC
jgi:hypothetical protein